MRKKSGGKSGSNEPQFGAVADAVAYYREKLALTEKAVTEKDKIVEKQAKTIAKRDATIEKRDKTIEKQIGTIAALRGKNRAQASTMKEMATKIKNLEAAMRRQEEIIKKQTLENKRTKKALEVALHDLNIECSAHKPTSQQMVRDTNGNGGNAPAVEGADNEGEAKPAKRRGPPKGHPGTTDKRAATHMVRARLPICKACKCKWIKITKMSKEFLTEVAKVIYEKIMMVHLEGNCVGCNERIVGEFQLDDVREIEPPGGTDDTTPSGAGPATGRPDGDDGTDGKAPVRSGGVREVSVGNGLVQLVRDEAAEENAAEAAEEAENPDLLEDAAAEHADEHADEDVKVGDIVEAVDIDGEKLEIPEKGRLGFNLLHAILLLWRHRVTDRGVVDILIRLHRLRLSTATIWYSLMRMANGLRPEYDIILKAILSSPYIHVDETSFYVGKEKMWVWVITTREGVYYFIDSRSTNYIKEILKDYKGILIVDGYHTYRLLPPEYVQRCVVHIDRDLKKWAKDEEKMTPHRRIARNFAKKVRSLIWDAKELKKAGRGPEMFEEMCARLDEVLKYYDRYPEIKKYVGYVRNAGRRIFTFMNYDYVDSDNNLAERAMREVVKHRVVKSLLRTKKGAEIFAILLTIMMTHKNSDVLELLKKYLARGRESGREKQDETSGNGPVDGLHASKPPDDGYG